MYLHIIVMSLCSFCPVCFVCCFKFLAFFLQHSNKDRSIEDEGKKSSTDSKNTELRVQNISTVVEPLWLAYNFRPLALVTFG
jgi:hypothetical protein